MKREITMIVLVTFMAACVSWPRGKVFKTAPQRWDYEELGPVEATGFGWTKSQAVNRAAQRLQDKAEAMGGNGVVATEVEEGECYYFWSGLLTALMFPPCWADAKGGAVRFEGKTKGGGREEE